MNSNWKLLDLTKPGLSKVATDLDSGNEELAKLDLANYFSTRKQVGFIKDVQQTTADIKKVASNHFEDNANRLVEHCFLFDKPWDMEKCFKAIHLDKKINWQYVYNDDPEWMYMLNRQNYLLDLIMQYLITENETYLNTYTDLIEQWLASESDSTGKEETTWRTLDTGIRLKNWTKQLEFLMPTNKLSGDFYLSLIGSIKKQCDYLIESYTNSEALSNWRILQFHGVYIIASFFPELIDSATWRKVAKERLEYCLNIQVTNDGFHWEQSMMYHHEVLLNALEAQQVAKNNNQSFSNEYLELLKRMLHASQHAIMPNYQQPCYGDSDIEDLRNIQTLSALVLTDFTVNPFSILMSPNLQLLVDYGTSAEDDLVQLRNNLSNQFPLDYAHEDVGNYFIRSGYTTNSSYLFFKNGFLGGGHGHSDLLSFDLVSNGESILIDPGRYTYKSNSQERTYYKSAAQHNTLVIDQKESTIQKGAWASSFVAQEIKQPVVINQPVVLLQGTHLGYAPEEIITRKIIIIKELNLTLVVDEIIANGSHQYDQHFHFSTDGTVDQDHTKITFKGATQTVNFYPLSQQELTVKDFNASPEYNRLVAAKECLMTTHTDGNTALLTLIANETRDKVDFQIVPITQIAGAPVDSHKNTALKIKQAGEEYLVVINHFEGQGNSRKIFVVEDTSMFGRVIVAKKVNGKFIPKVLAY